MIGIGIGLQFPWIGAMGGAPPVDPTISKFIPAASSGLIASDGRVFKVRAEE